MPILSYLAYPQDGKLNQMVLDLEEIPQCQLHPAENRELAVLVTDTMSDKEELELQTLLEGVSSVQSLAMVFGHE